MDLEPQGPPCDSGGAPKAIGHQRKEGVGSIAAGGVGLGAQCVCAGLVAPFPKMPSRDCPVL